MVHGQGRTVMPILRRVDYIAGQRIGRTLVFVLLISIAGCDPGMTVRQINSVVEAENAVVTKGPKISISVKTTQQLIGERWYSPRVTATNPSDIPVKVTGVELITGRQTLKNEDIEARNYPIVLGPRSSVALGVDFRFSDGVDVAKAFRNPGELRIYFTSQEGDGVVRITVVGGHAN